MIKFKTDECILTCFGQANFLVDQVVQRLSHTIGCDQQVVEVRHDEGTLDEIKDLYHITYNSLMRGHQHQVCIEACRTFVQVARPYASDCPSLGLNVYKLRVYLELLVPDDYIDPSILHLLPPVDIRLLIEAG